MIAHLCDACEIIDVISNLGIASRLSLAESNAPCIVVCTISSIKISGGGLGGQYWAVAVDTLLRKKYPLK